MDEMLLLGVILAGGALAAAVVLLYALFLAPKKSQLVTRSLMGTEDRSQLGKARVVEQATEDALADITREVVRRRNDTAVFSFEDKLFQAGLFSTRDKERVATQRTFFPIIGGVGMLVFCYTGAGATYALIGGILGALVGMRLPYMLLDRSVARRHEEIMYFLPLVIEQIAIGVSSSLDIGPCIARVIDMADERDTHNAVTELLRFSQNYVKSGATFEEAINEVGIKSGHNELKHTFKSLGQVAKHGGEVTRQLQELAEAVGLQRESKIEERIKLLELKATGPLGLVFVGFFIMLLSGFFLQITGIFNR